MNSPQSLNMHTRVPYVSPLQPVTTTSEYPRRVTIGMLSNEVLLNIFRYYLDASPRCWPWLVHVCRKWRRIVFASQRTLHLRLFCVHGTPVLKTLDCWPALPIVVEYGGAPALEPPSPEDEDNIMAALKRCDRVSSIHLTITTSLLIKLSSIEEPFSNLEDLVLLYEGRMGSYAFQWGPRFGRLHSTGISLQQLSSSKNLVDIQLHKTGGVVHFSPESLANALSGMTQLQSLSLHLYSSNPGLYPDNGIPLLSLERMVLPALAYLKFRGTGDFFDRFMARIDPPLLGDIEITFEGHSFVVSNLFKIIDRIDMQKSHSRAEVSFSEHAISITFTQPEAPTHPKLRISFRPQFQWQFTMISIIDIYNRLGAFLSGVEDLHIHATGLSSGQGNMDCEQWAMLIHPFIGTKWLHIAGNLSTDIVLSLQLSRERRESLLPSLYKIYIRKPEPHCTHLRDAVRSLMASRRLSGHILGVEYERLRINELCGKGQQVTTKILSDDVLLYIFRHYLDASPQYWPTLAHVCRRWRQVVLISPLGLHLRLYCTYGTPVLKRLECWPPLPLVVNYGGSPMLDPPGCENEENIMAALKQFDRVVSINLAVTNPLLKNISTISKPYSELKELVLLSRDSLTLPNAFRSGQRLRTLHLTRIAVPTLPQLLSLSTGLVNLRLHEIPYAGYFPPDAFANALSGMTQLETLSLHFLSLPPRRNFLDLPPQPWQRVVLSALTCLEYRGTSKYLDSLVARIDAPRLGGIDITFFSQPTMDASQLGRFIEGLETQTSLNEADIQASAHSISICFSKPGTPTRLGLRISCKQLDWQLSSMTQICNQLSPFLSRVTDLGILSTQSPGGNDDMDSEQWVELIRAFDGAANFRVAGVHVTDILCALRPADGGHTTVLPALRSLHVRETVPIVGPSWDAVQLLITSRRLSGRPVELYVGHFSCNLCNTSFTHQEEVKRHHLDKHVPRMHLKAEHSEVAHTDPLTSNTASQSFSSSYSGSHGALHNGHRASIIMDDLHLCRAAGIPCACD